MNQTVRRTIRQVVLSGPAALAGAWLLCGGCGLGREPIQPLTPDAFVQRRPANTIGNPVDKPGPLLYNDVHVDLLPPENPGGEPVRIGKVVRESVKAPDAEAGRAPGGIKPDGMSRTGPSSAPAYPPIASTRPATVRPRPAATTGPAVGDPSGQWLTLGNVLMEVNGQPIFSDRVLTALERPLAAEAKKNSETRFRQIADALLQNQVNLYKREELEFASAQRSLGPEDDSLAKALTIQWRQKKITEAGGSLELAKRRAAADGWDFDKLVEQQNRLHLVQIYYQKRIIPLIQVPAAAIRAYYNTHKEAEFTTHGQAKFRVIKIDPRNYPGLKEEAYAKAQEVKKRAAGEDFAQLAASVNDDTGWRDRGGAVGDRDGWVQKGAFRVEEVEKAVWNLRPGQVTDIIPAGGAFYIAKLEELKEDAVDPFDKLDVQDRIREKLRAEQFQVLRDQHVAKLEKEAVTRRNDGTLKAALDMVMKRYPQWASAQ